MRYHVFKPKEPDLLLHYHHTSNSIGTHSLDLAFVAEGSMLKPGDVIYIGRWLQYNVFPEDMGEGSWTGLPTAWEEEGLTVAGGEPWNKGTAARLLKEVRNAA